MIKSTMHYIDNYTKNMVDTIWCQFCRKYEKQIEGTKDFSRSCVNGFHSHRSSNIIDHASSDQHTIATDLLQKETAKSSNMPVISYAPILKSMQRMKESELHRMMRKFDLCYVLARENLAFRKYPALLQFEKRHGVDSGTSYLSHIKAKEFVGYIAESQRLQFRCTLKESKFYGVVIDGSTDVGTVEDELGDGPTLQIGPHGTRDEVFHKVPLHRSTNDCGFSWPCPMFGIQLEVSWC